MDQTKPMKTYVNANKKLTQATHDSQIVDKGLVPVSCWKSN